MANNYTTISKKGIEYLCGLINQLANVSEGIDDLNLRTDGTFSSVKIDTLLNTLKTDCNEYTDRLVANLSRLELKIATSESEITQPNTMYLYKPSGSSSYEQYVVIEGTKVLLGTTDINMGDYYTIAQADGKFVLKTDFDSLKTEVDKKVNKTDIVDNLTSTDTDKPLSANQGKVLKDDLGDKASLTTTVKENVVEAINELDAEIGDISTLNTTEKTDIVAAINELQEMQPEVARKDLENKAEKVTLDATPTQNIVVDEDIEITLPTDLSFRKIRLNLVNSKAPNYIASTSTTPGALVVVDNDVLVSGQIRLSDANKYGGTFIVGNYVEFVSGEIMATFKQGDVIKKFKVGADSLNEFEMLLNEGKSVIRKFSDVEVELTTEEEQAGIMK